MATTVPSPTPVTIWVYNDGSVIQGSETGPSLKLPVDTNQLDSIILRDEQRRVVECQCSKTTNPSVVIDSEGVQYQGFLMDGDHSYAVTLKIINKDTGKAVLATFRNYRQITQDLAQDKIRVTTNYYGKILYSYVSNDVTWKCLGEANIYEGNKIIIQTYAVINSDPDKQVQARLKIVTGLLHNRPRPYYSRSSDLVSMAMPIDQSEESSSNEDLLVHDVGVKVLSGITKLSLSESATLEGSKVYFHNTRDQKLTYAGYRIPVKDIIPACQLTVKQMYAENSKVLGIVDIKEHRPGSILDIKLSSSTAVEVDSLIVTLEDKPTREDLAVSLGIVPTKTWRSITEQINIKLTNNTTVRQTVIVCHPLDGKILLETSMNNGQYRYTGRYLEVPIAVDPPSNPGQSKIISITITTGVLSDNK